MHGPVGTLRLDAAPWSSALAALALALVLLAPPGGRATETAAAVSPSWYHATEGGAVSVDLYVFWSRRCPHCRRAVRFIDDELIGELPWLDVHLHEISEPANAARYQAFAAALGVEATYVPAFFYCGRSFQGYGDDQTTGRRLRDGLSACHERLRTALAEGRTAEAAIAEGPIAPPIRLPVLGELDPEALSLPALTVVLGGLDAFNPCAFFVLLFLLSLMVHARSRARMALVGGVFVLTSGLVYFVFMAAWLNLFLVVGYLPAVTAFAGLVAIVVAAINIKDFVWFKRGISLTIPEQAKPGLFQRMRGLVAASSLPAMLAGTAALALAANAYELLCTAGFPLVFTRILTLRDLSAGSYYGYLALYNVVYVLPLLAIVVVFVATLGARRLGEDEGRVLKLLSGLMMLGLGLALLIAPDTLSQPLTALALIALALILTAVIVGLRKLAGPTGRRPT